MASAARMEGCGDAECELVAKEVGVKEKTGAGPPWVRAGGPGWPDKIMGRGDCAGCRLIKLTLCQGALPLRRHSDQHCQSYTDSNGKWL